MRLPITAKLNPLEGFRALRYMVQAAILSRLVTGFVRIWQNAPSKQHDPRLTPNQKRQALWERLFVELVGTLGYIGTLHLGQDLVAKAFESRIKLPSLSAGKHLSTDEARLANRAIEHVYGKDAKGLVCRVLYGQETVHKGEKTLLEANLINLRETLHIHIGPNKGDALFEKIRPTLEKFADHVNSGGRLTVLGGIAISALFGGVVIQWMNDRIYAPMVHRALEKRFGSDPKASKSVSQKPVPQPALSVKTPQNSSQPALPDVFAPQAPPAILPVSSPQPNLKPYSTAPMPSFQPAAMQPLRGLPL